MCLAIEQIREESKEQGMAEGKIEGTIQTCKDLGLSKDKTIEHVMKVFEKSATEAEKFVEQYWNTAE